MDYLKEHFQALGKKVEKMIKKKEGVSRREQLNSYLSSIKKLPEVVDYAKFRKDTTDDDAVTRTFYAVNEALTHVLQSRQLSFKGINKHFRDASEGEDEDGNEVAYAYPQDLEFLKQFTIP